jgi:two-component system sensor histidine kinase FlrB
MNLINNSLQAAGKGARLAIACRVLPLREPCLSIVVQDNGPGFDAGIAQKISELFFTTKEQGTGLGLAVVRAVADAHHGEFSISAEPGAGARAELRLPVLAAREHIEPSRLQPDRIQIGARDFGSRLLSLPPAASQPAQQRRSV